MQCAGVPRSHDESAEHHAKRAALWYARGSFVRFPKTLCKCIVDVECFLVSGVGVDDVVGYAGKFGESVEEWAVDLVEALEDVGSGAGVWCVCGTVVLKFYSSFKPGIVGTKAFDAGEHAIDLPVFDPGTQIM